MSTPADDVRLSFGRRAAIFATPKVVSFLAVSGHRMARVDPNAYEVTLLSTSPLEQFGNAVLRALDASMFIPAKEVIAFFAKSNDLGFDDWVCRFALASGKKSATSVPANTSHCSVTLISEKIEITPLRKRKGAAWEGFDAEVLTICSTAGPLVVGDAVAEALRRCIPSHSHGT